MTLLDPLSKHSAKECRDGERFGDFVIRAGIVKATPAGNKVHDEVKVASA